MVITHVTTRMDLCVVRHNPTGRIAVRKGHDMSKERTEHEKEWSLSIIVCLNAFSCGLRKAA